MISLPDTLCWTCLNAVPNYEGTIGCSWSEELKPVEGWKAKKTKSRYGKPGYLVIECPQYVYDKISCRMQGSKQCKTVHMMCKRCPFKKELTHGRRVCKTAQKYIE